MRQAVMLLLCLLLAGCGGDEGPRIPSVTGSWAGAGSEAGLSYILELTLVENNGTVTGSGSIASGTTFALTVTGSHVHPDVTLTMAAPGVHNLQFSGEFTNDNSIRGQLDGSGFEDAAITIGRQ